MQLRHLPNVISCLRLLLIVPILWALISEHYSLAFYLFLVAGISDGLDGLLARLYGWTTRFGAFIDPVADKLLLMGSFITLGLMGHIPLALAILVIARDVWIIGGALSYQYWIGPLEFKPLFMSKLNTFFQLLLLITLLVNLGLFKLPPLFLQTLIVLVFITTSISFIQYTWEWSWRAIKNYKPPRTNKEII